MENEFFNKDEPGMLCNCLPECVRTQYKTEMEPYLSMWGKYWKVLKIFSIISTPSRTSKRNDTATMDFHYGSPEMVRYRTDITFGWLDLMGESTVSFTSIGAALIQT